MSFQELWNRLHQEHGRKAIVGGNARDEDGYRASGFHGADRLEVITGSLDGKACIDYGCGDGRVSEHVADRCRQLVCVDASNDILETCKVRLAGKTNVVFARADWPRELPKSNSDVAYAMSVAYHLTDLQTFILMRDMLGLLGRGGMFVFDFCNVHHDHFDRLLTLKMSEGDWSKPWPWVVQDGATLQRVALLVGYKSAEIISPNRAQPMMRCIAPR
jgi:trans-aconitate methyltransferase